MFFAFLSMTLFPGGVILLFLEKGHSRMVPDRVTANCRAAFKGDDHYLPQHLVAKMNTVKNIKAEYIDYTDESSFIFEGWDDLFHDNLDSIPYLKNLHGYTSSHFYEFKMGQLEIRFTHESEVLYRHAYVKDPNTSLFTEESAKICGDHLMSLIFKPGKNFTNAAYNDIRIHSEADPTAYLRRHEIKSIDPKKLKSIEGRFIQIPRQFHYYYPSSDPAPVANTTYKKIVNDVSRSQILYKKKLPLNLKKESKKSNKNSSPVLSQSIVKYFGEKTSSLSISKSKPVKIFNAWQQSMLMSPVNNSDVSASFATPSQGETDICNRGIDFIGLSIESNNLDENPTSDETQLMTQSNAFCDTEINDLVVTQSSVVPDTQLNELLVTQSIKVPDSQLNELPETQLTSPLTITQNSGGPNCFIANESHSDSEDSFFANELPGESSLVSDDEIPYEFPPRAITRSKNLQVRPLDRTDPLNVIVETYRNLRYRVLYHPFTCNYNNQIVHFSWDSNSCAFDCTMTLIWVAYLHLKNIFFNGLDGTVYLRRQYKWLFHVFEKLYTSSWSNYQAKDELESLLNILDEGWLDNTFCSTDLIWQHILNTNVDLNPTHTTTRSTECSDIFHWKYEVFRKCILCDTILESSRHVDFTCMPFPILLPESGEVNLSQVMNNFFDCTTHYERLRSTGNNPIHTCIKCNAETIHRKQRRTISSPYILAINFPTARKNKLPDERLPEYLPENLEIQSQVYQLIGCSYGDGIHFVSRFIYNDNAYHADGMQKSPTDRTIYEALGVKLTTPMQESFSRRILCQKTKSGYKRGGKLVNDAVYIKVNNRWILRKYFVRFLIRLGLLGNGSEDPRLRVVQSIIKGAKKSKQEVAAEALTKVFSNKFLDLRIISYL